MIERVDNNGNSYEAARVVSIAFEEPEILAETLKAVGGMVAACINGNSPERVTLRRTETCCFLDIEETVHSDGVTMLLYFAAGQIAAGEMFSPPEVMMRSFLRSTTDRKPSRSSDPMSPVCSQPPASISWAV